MPKVVSTSATVRKELKTCPPDGFVMLKRLPYGEKLGNQEIGGKLKFQAERQRGSRTAQTLNAEMSMVNKKAIAHTWANCIIDHNLEDENGTKYDFTKEEDIWRLPSHVGEEIDTYLDELNNFEGDLGNSKNGSMDESSSTAKT